MIEFIDVSRRTIADTGEIEVTVNYKRTKTKGVPKMDKAIITGEIEIKAITGYENCCLPGSPRCFWTRKKGPSVKKTGLFYGLGPKLLFKPGERPALAKALQNML